MCHWGPSGSPQERGRWQKLGKEWKQTSTQSTEQMLVVSWQTARPCAPSRPCSSNTRAPGSLGLLRWAEACDRARSSPLPGMRVHPWVTKGLNYRQFPPFTRAPLLWLSSVALLCSPAVASTVGSGTGALSGGVASRPG